ncbi:tonB-system energizer ExbB [Aurantimonas aggregata]|uniref:Biopolymer transport protein ExbB n=1 Tax=Aurantimonas aggregata TaxID=2047720 RepID=A0A6L9MJF7_9HYPH|nr:tonB-system energizer ExbB [Aurantimonas aggregata]NDV87610.1 tonB-system energizer ExbB [Aurantimonas aggregata]
MTTIRNVRQRAALIAALVLLPLIAHPALAQDTAPAAPDASSAVTAPENAPATSPAPAVSDPAATAAPSVAEPSPADVPAATGDGATAPAPETAAPPAAEAASPDAVPADTAEPTVSPVDADAPAGATQPGVTELAAPARSETLPHDLSPLGMFLAADWVVKAVMIGLAFASLVTWTIFVAKGIEIAFAKRRASADVRRLERAPDLVGAIGDERSARRWRSPVGLLAKSAEAERARSAGLSDDGVKERAQVALSRIESRGARSINRGTGVLATIGSTAPFVGLFGTVWGIMNSFIGISEANTTNLAVVAPGIAEALLATAIGLVAAIPAVIIYNVFARSIAGYRAILSDGSAVVLQHLSRELDQDRAGARRAARLAEAAE